MAKIVLERTGAYPGQTLTFDFSCWLQTTAARLESSRNINSKILATECLSFGATRCAKEPASPNTPSLSLALRGVSQERKRSTFRNLVTPRSSENAADYASLAVIVLVGRLGHPIAANKVDKRHLSVAANTRHTKHADLGTSPPLGHRRVTVVRKMGVQVLSSAPPSHFGLVVTSLRQS